MKRILTVVGARPQIIKASAISRAIRESFTGRLEEIILHTGQHYDLNMSEVFFREMDIPAPHIHLEVGSGSHAVQTARMLEGIESAITEYTPDAVLVYGDTNSTLAAALAAAKLHTPVVHVEAGLRSFDKRMPEEINRITCDHVSTLLFTPTAAGLTNLANEGFDPACTRPWNINHPGVFHCGDIMLDNTLHFAEQADPEGDFLRSLGLDGTAFLLTTVHRDSNTDDLTRLSGICEGLCRIAGHTSVVFPVHPRTRQALERHAEHPDVFRLLHHERIMRIPPASFLEMIALERACTMVITDSGGVQKEAFFLRKPGIVLRPHTEWIEIAESGHAVLADADPDAMVRAYHHFQSGPAFTWPPLFGDGRAAEFICTTLLEALP